MKQKRFFSLIQWAVAFEGWSCGCGFCDRFISGGLTQWRRHLVKMLWMHKLIPESILFTYLGLFPFSFAFPIHCTYFLKWRNKWAYGESQVVESKGPSFPYSQVSQIVPRVMGQCQETRGTTGPGEVQFLTTHKLQRMVPVRASVTFTIYHEWDGPPRLVLRTILQKYQGKNK